VAWRCERDVDSGEEENIMTMAKEFIKTHSLPIYFTLTFVISWGVILLIAGPGGIPEAADQAMILGMAMLLGPSLAGTLLTALTAGREGLGGLLSSAFRWRVGARWYAVALLTAPLATVIVLFVLVPFSPRFLPSILNADEKLSLLFMGLVAGLFVGTFEELGWTGFAVPTMRLRSGMVTTGIVIGLLWGAWHFIMFWERDSCSGALPLAILLARLFAWLPAYRILLVWVFDHTESLLVVILMHVSLVATLVITEPPLTGEWLLIFILGKAVVLWFIVAAVTMARRRIARRT
jgi:uncharacterized protein